MCQSNKYDNVESLLNIFSKENKKLLYSSVNDTNMIDNEMDKNDASESPDKIQMNNCSSCDHDGVVIDRGIIYCSNCGVISDLILDVSPEWRFYGANDSKNTNPTRCGFYSMIYLIFF